MPIFSARIFLEYFDGEVEALAHEVVRVTVVAAIRSRDLVDCLGQIQLLH